MMNTLSRTMGKRLAAIAAGNSYATSVRDRTFDALRRRELLAVVPSRDDRGRAVLTAAGVAALDEGDLR